MRIIHPNLLLHKNLTPAIILPASPVAPLSDTTRHMQWIIMVLQSLHAANPAMIARAQRGDFLDDLALAAAFDERPDLRDATGYYAESRFEDG